MNMPYHVSNLSRVLEIGKAPEEEDVPNENCYFDENGNYVMETEWWTDFYFPWEWIYMDDIRAKAIELGMELPDGTIDYRRVF